MENFDFEYSIEYLDFTTNAILHKLRLYYPMTSSESLLHTRFLVGQSYREFVSFQKPENNQENLLGKFTKRDRIKILVTFSWSKYEDKAWKKESIELSHTFQNAREQLNALELEYNFYKKYFPKFKGMLISEYECSDVNGKINVVDNRLFLEDNYLVMPIQYSVDIQVINISNEIIFNISRSFTKDSSFTNRIQALLFIGGVYATFKLFFKNLENEKELRLDQMCIYNGQKCTIKRELTITKFDSSNNPMSIVLTNDYSNSEKILYLLHKEFEFYRQMNIAVEYDIRFSSNDYFTWGDNTATTGASFSTDRFDGLIWHKKPESPYFVIYPYEQLRSGSLYLTGELPVKLHLKKV